MNDTLRKAIFYTLWEKGIDLDQLLIARINIVIFYRKAAVDMVKVAVRPSVSLPVNFFLGGLGNNGIR